MFTVIDVTSPTFTDQHWQQYYDMLAELRQRYKSNFSASSWQSLKERVISYAQVEKGYARIAILEDNKIVGWINMRLHGADTPEEAVYLAFDALYDEIPDALTDLIGVKTGNWLDRHAGSVVFCMSHDFRTTAAAERWKAEKLGRFDEYVLNQTSANTDAMGQWVNSIPETNRGIRIQFFEEVPDQHLATYVDMFNQFILDMPLEGDSGTPFHMDIEEQKKIRKWCRENRVMDPGYLMFDSNDDMIGFTAVSVNLDNPADIFQMMTGVLSEYRGRGLAKWLKAVMFFKIGEMFPDNQKITTIMRAVNEPIQHLNALMGFTLQREGFELKIPRQGLTPGGA